MLATSAAALACANLAKQIDAATAKLGLYTQTRTVTGGSILERGSGWQTIPGAGHTKPDYATVEGAVRLQFQSGEGAIQYVPEAAARANVDILAGEATKRFPGDLHREGREAAKRYLAVAFEAQYGEARRA